ncbi:MAG: DUF2079 domain-containing protein [Candidatus Thermoplasmatota archaeon]|nr:DUF2079 domain-containing protein [Candidatus Thermoplasmatota archaeon]
MEPESGTKKNGTKTNISSLPKAFRENWIPFIIAMIFGSIFSIISYMRYLAFSQNVLDLGVNASLLYSVSKIDFLSSPSNPYPIAVNKLLYIPLGAIYALYPKEWIILFYQDFFLSLSGFVLYLISRFYKLSFLMSLTVEVLFFIYYPVSGIFWFDFHFMAFFPTLFLITFYLYKKNSSRWPYMAFLATITDFMAPVLIFLFVLIEIVKKFRKEGLKVRPIINEITVLIASSIVFLLPFLYYRADFVSHYVNNYTPLGLYSDPYFKIEFFARTVIPFLLVPLIGIEYAILSIPFAVMIFFNNYLPYENLMFFQYPSLYAPFVMISLIVGLKRISANGRSWKKVKIALTAMIIVNVALFSFYTPIGDIYTHKYDNNAINPWLTGSQSFYETAQKITPTEQDSKLMYMTGLVPQGSSILIQGNFPEFAQGYDFICPGQYIGSSPPQFIITDPYNYHFSFPIEYNGKYVVYYKEVNSLLQNYSYGIYAYFQGDYLFKLGYKGMPVLEGNTSYNVTLPDFRNINGAYTSRLEFLNPGYIEISGNLISSQKSPVTIYLGKSSIFYSNNSTVKFDKIIISTSYLVDLNISIVTGNIESLNMNILEWGA